MTVEADAAEVGEVNDFLPDNAPPFLRTLAGLSAHLEEVDPQSIETIWDAWRCPAPLLPWLAWALSVDVWDDSWDEIRRRQAIADSPFYHRIKGSVRAVKSALALALRPYELTEWFDHLPPRRRGTATIFVETTLDDLPRILRAIRPLVLAAKPKSRAASFGVGELAADQFNVGLGLLEETLITVEAYAYPGEDAEGAFVLGAGLLSEELTTIEAYA